MVDLGREPSMEEILSSIRRVMARDDAQRGAVSHGADDVLELTAAQAAPHAILSEASAAAGRNAFSALAAAASPQAAVSGTTLDALVMEALRPMLKQWLDTNLPAIVEDMVQREIDRISGR